LISEWPQTIYKYSGLECDQQSLIKVEKQLRSCVIDNPNNTAYDLMKQNIGRQSKKTTKAEQKRANIQEGKRLRMEVEGAQSRYNIYMEEKGLKKSSSRKRFKTQPETSSVALHPEDISTLTPPIVTPFSTPNSHIASQPPPATLFYDNPGDSLSIVQSSLSPYQYLAGTSSEAGPSTHLAAGDVFYPNPNPNSWNYIIDLSPVPPPQESAASSTYPHSQPFQHDEYHNPNTRYQWFH
jgi:hypothetical protein